MRIEVDISASYDWEPFDGKPKDGDVVVEGMKGPVKRILKNGKTTTSITVPDSDLKEMAELPGEDTLEERLAAHIKHVMSHHAPRKAWVAIHCPDDAGLQRSLRRLLLPSKE
jgi:hypothetical protein